MAGSEAYIQLLATIPAFAALGQVHLRTLYGHCALRVLAKGETASVAGEAVDELRIVVSGRIGTAAGGQEAGQGSIIEAQAFFTRGPAEATAIALRETVALTLGWEDLTAAIQESPDLVAALAPRLWPGIQQPARVPAKLSRLVICPAGPAPSLEPGVQQALLAGFESIAEVRVLTRQSYGAGLPGALALDSPGIAHWLQEQELEFDLTVILPDEADAGFAMDAIEEADNILFVAAGGDPGLSALEHHALERRGPQNCALVLAKPAGGAVKDAAAWTEPRRYRFIQTVDFAAPDAVRLLCQVLLGKGNAIAAASPGVYAAAILGALEAFEEHGQPAVFLAAAGSAVLPAGLLACGVKFPVIETIFRELANPALWRRASRAETGLCDPSALDHFLVGALRGLEISAAVRPFAAVSRSLSAGRPEIHREGRLHGAARAGIAPPGILPPLILDGGGILVSGEGEGQALLAAAQSLSVSTVSFLHAQPPALGITPMTYRSLTGPSLFRLTQSPADKRVRLETVLCAGEGGGSIGFPRSLAVPIPDGIMPMDWPQWAKLRDAGYQWASRELETGALEWQPAAHIAHARL